MKNRILFTPLVAASVLFLAVGSVYAQGTTPGNTSPGTRPDMPLVTPTDPSGRPTAPTTSPPGPAGTGTKMEAQQTPPSPSSSAPGMAEPANRPPDVTYAPGTVLPAEENRLMQWLPWILAAVAVVAILAFLAMRRKGGQVIAAGSNVAPPKSPDTKTK